MPAITILNRYRLEDLLAGAMGGALVGRRRQARIFRIASGEVIEASILILSPQRGPARTSNSNTRAIN